MKSITKVIVSLIIVAIIIIIVVVVSVSRKKNDYTFYKVERGSIVQEITETGTIQKGDKISLSFKTTGQLKEVYVKTGDEAKKGAILAKLDNYQLYIQLEQANADLDLAQAELDRLLAGASKEEIQVAQTAVDNAKTTLANEEKDLENAEAEADQDLEDAYEDALNTLNDSYLKLYNALVVVGSIQNGYFTNSDRDSSDVKEYQDDIENGLDEMDFYLQKAEDSFTEQNVDFALVNFGKNLSEARGYLTEIRVIVEKLNYRNVVSSIDKTSLDTQRTNINTAYTNVISEQQDIASVKLTNKSSIDTAESAVGAAKDALRAAEDNLALVTAEPREADINLCQAKVKSARARADMLQSQIQDTVLKSPTDGIIISIEKFAGETVQATVPVISFLPSEELDVEVDIYEEDVVSVEQGNAAEIHLVAFPERVFQGRVAAIDPAERLRDGVVYYRVIIVFEEDVPDFVRPGMTVDVEIITQIKEDALIVPRGAVQRKEGKSVVEVFKDGLIEERVVQIGIWGDDMAEIISGLEEGEEVVIK